VNRISVIRDLDPSTYQRSVLHAEDCAWVEKNCYVDIWIETLHALRLNPVAVMPFTLAVDFEGDQWTFFKPPHDELRDLYGIDVQELTVWRPLLEHAVEHISAGKLVSTEADAFWLPDTAGTDYRSQHTKTTIVINEIDVANRHMGYFHNAAYYSLKDEDFVNTFRVGFPADATHMPFFAELIRVDRVIRRSEKELATLAWQLLHKHCDRRPLTNPIEKFKQRLAQDLPILHERGLQHYHAWAFASTRQVGAAFELAAKTLRWLESHGYANLESAAISFSEISNANKAFILKGARSVNAKRALDLAATFDSMSAAWTAGMQSLAIALK
jgi:hypothetical protein